MINLNLKNNKYTIVFFLIILLFTIVRIIISFKLPYYSLVNTPHDNDLLLSYVNLERYYNSWNIWTLSKNQIYSLFLYIVKISKIPYGIWMGILWVLAALSSTYVIFKYITKNKIFLLIAYLFILFLPFGFDMLCTSNIYRNGVFIPFLLMFLSSLIIFTNLIISKEKESNLKMIICGLIVGFLFFINFYIKEDGIILVPIFIIPIIFAILFKITKQNNFKSIIKIIIIGIIPLLIFSLGTLAYTEINNHYFGVSEINTRTEGELGEFYHNLLLIEDNNKTNVIWIPFSTIEKAWNASPTLQSHPELLNAIATSKWANYNYKSNPLPGDIFTWDLRINLNNTELYSNEKQANDLFYQVNQELKDSFNNKTLEKTDKIIVTSSLPGKSIDEIFDLKSSIKLALKEIILYEGIDITTPEATATQVMHSDNLSYIENILNQELISPDHGTSINENDLMYKILDINTFIYKIASIFIILLSLIGFLITFAFQIKNKFKNRIINSLLGFQILLAITFAAELIAVCWFSQACGIFNYYLLRCATYLILFEVLSIGCLVHVLEKNNFITTLKKS